MQKDLILADILTFPVITIAEDCSVRDALALMRDTKVSSLVIVEEQRPTGIFTERDVVLFTYQHRNTEEVSVGEVMSRAPLTAYPQLDYRDGYRMLAENRVRHLVVVDHGGKLAGVVSEGDFLDHLGNEFLVKFKEVSSLMTTNVLTLTQQAPVEQAIRLMAKEKISCVVVAEEGRPYGIFTERDLVRLESTNEYMETILLGSVMSSPVHVVRFDKPLFEALQQMEKMSIRRLIVVDRNGLLVGLVTRHDIVRLLYDRQVEQLRQILQQREQQLEEVQVKLKGMHLLQRVEERLAEIQKLAKIGSWEMDLESGELWWSEGMYQILEIDDKELLPSLSHFFDYVHVDDRQRVEQAYHDSLEHHVEAECEFRLQLANNVIKYAITRCRRLDELPGGLKRAVGSLQDITDRANAELALRDSERKVNTLLSNLPGMAYRCLNDACWSMEFVSEGCRSLTGYDADQLQFNRDVAFADLIEDDDREEVVEGIARSVQADEHFEIIYRIRRRDGELRWVWEQGRSVPGSDHKEQRLEGFITDITDRKIAEQKLADAEVEWMQAVDHFDHAVYLLDFDHRLVRANRRFYQMLDLDPVESEGLPIAELWHGNMPHPPCPICEALEHDLEGPVVLEADDLNNPVGVPIEVSVKLIRDSQGIPSSVLMSLVDLRSSRKIEERLRLSASVFENTTEGVMVTDPNGSILEVNHAFCDILGYSLEEVREKSPGMFQSGRHDQAFYEAMWSTLMETGRWRGEIWNRRKGGGVVPLWQTINGVFDDDNQLTHFVSVFSDISQIKQSQDQLDYLAHHDALTDMPNRLLLSERLNQAVRHAQRRDTQLAVIFLDLDHFKNINDSMGHPAGDKLLKKVASILQDCVREDDTVARLGGDEFVLLMEDVLGPEQVVTVAQKLLERFRQPLEFDRTTIIVTASLGICLYPDDGGSADELLRNADAAMYRAKEEGRNTYQFYTEELTQKAYQRVLVENDLRLALERNELILVYQPQISLDTGNIIGVEALLRWNHSDLGIILPGNFIEIAEESGLILPIGEWVLHEACRQAKLWLQHGVRIGRIAVNVSGRQIQRGTLVGQVSHALQKTGLPPELLELEITENFIMQHAQMAIDQLEELRNLGVNLAIDDFGTGYSSLSYLKQLPIHKLKIDRSFIRDIPEDADDMAISRAIIAMSKEMGMISIAEGVETRAQAEYLKNEGCNEAQGYLFSHPITADRLEDFKAVKVV